jgi:hypothetical protein
MVRDSITHLRLEYEGLLRPLGPNPSDARITEKLVQEAAWTHEGAEALVAVGSALRSVRFARCHRAWN